MLCAYTQSCLTLRDLVDCSPSGSSVHGDSLGKNTGVALPCPPPGDLPNPGIEPRSPALQVDSLPAEPPGKPLRSQLAIFPTMEKAQQGMIRIISVGNK